MHILPHRSRLCGFYVAAAALSMCNGVDLSGNRYDVDSLASCVSDGVSNRCKNVIVPLWNVTAAELCVLVRLRLRCVCHSAGMGAAVCIVRLHPCVTYPPITRHANGINPYNLPGGCHRKAHVRIKRMVGLHNCHRQTKTRSCHSTRHSIRTLILQPITFG